MNKELQAKLETRKALLTLDSETGVVQEKEAGNVTNAVVDDLVVATGFEWSEKTLNDTMKALALNSNAIMGAGAEISAEAFASSKENDVHRVDVNFGSQINVQANFTREKSWPTRDMKTGESTGTVTHFNSMSGGSFTVKGAANKTISNHAKEFGNKLLKGE